MITLKAFVTAIHSAIMQAGDSLMDKNIGLLDTYFKESDTPDKNLVPKTVVLEYQTMSSDGSVVTNKVHVPLITLVPLTIAQIEKAKLTADFEMDVVDGELQLDFKSRKGFSLGGLFKKPEKQTGRLEITLAPQETPEGLKVIVEGYEATLKQQMP